jgi:hypothetical protein
VSRACPETVERIGSPRSRTTPYTYARRVTNGKPGDSPITDIVLYGKPVFSPRTDALSREIEQFTDDYGVYDPFEPVEEILWEVEYDRKREAELYEALVTLRERLSRERN